MVSKDEKNRILAKLRSAHTADLRGKAELREEVERIYEERLALLKAEKVAIFREGLMAGISKSALGRAIGTTNWDTISWYVQHAGSIEATKAAYSWGAVERYFGPNTYIAWVLEEGKEVTSTYAEVTHPGYAVMHKDNGYTLNTETEVLGHHEFQTQYPELFAWVQENPPAAPEATEPVNPEPVAEEWEEEEYDD